MILIALLALAMLCGGVALFIILLPGDKKPQNNQQFEVLPEVRPEISSWSASQAPPGPIEGNLTERLFDSGAYGSALKSYVLELYDLRKPGQGYRVNVDDSISIGRSQACTICIPNRTLSGTHCEIILRDGRLFLRDLDSLNGTFLNGNPNKITEAYLESGSVIQIGSEKLQVQLKQVNG